jgi:hypothetical protein
MHERLGERLARCRSTLLAAAVATSVLTACSGSSPGGTSGAVGEPLNAARQGFFRGGNVAGLRYVSGQQSGITDAKGGYTCDPDEVVAFSVGALALGETDCATIAHAVALSPGGELTDQTSLNIMRLLLILDHDENPDNGVFISEPLRSIAENWAPIDFTATDFEPELAPIISDIASLESRVVDDVPGNGDAFVFLDASLSCAYSGVYYRVFQSGPVIATNTATLNIFRDLETNTDVGDFLLVRQNPISALVGVGTGSMQLSTLPTLSGTSFTADFLSPDNLAVTWSAFAQQSWDRNGASVVSRLGDANGEYRFAGTIEAFGTPLRPSLLKKIALKLEGEAFSGEAIDNGLGVRHAVMGQRLPDSNDYELEIESLGLATGTIVVNADGEPVGLRGNWPGYEDMVLEAVGCRLI